MFKKNIIGSGGLRVNTSLGLKAALALAARHVAKCEDIFHVAKDL